MYFHGSFYDVDLVKKFLETWKSYFGFNHTGVFKQDEHVSLSVLDMFSQLAKQAQDLDRLNAEDKRVCHSEGWVTLDSCLGHQLLAFGFRSYPLLELSLVTLNGALHSTFSSSDGLQPVLSHAARIPACHGTQELLQSHDSAPLINLLLLTYIHTL